MAWSNPGGTYNAQDMDSSDGTNAQKLSVRNASAPAPDGNWRAEIKETGISAQALKVDGKIKLERGGNYGGMIEPVNGGGLDITAQDSHDVTIGSASNDVILVGTNITIGDAGVGTAILMNGASVQIASGNLIVNGQSKADHVRSNDMDSYFANEQLNVGAQASAVQLGVSGRETQINGTLNVLQTAYLPGGVAGPLNVDGTLVANGLDVNGSADISNVLTAAVLDVNGPGDVSGDLTVHGALQRSDVFTADDIVQITAATTMVQSAAAAASLYVKHSNAAAQQPALDAISTSGQAAVRATGPTVALATSGRTEFGGEARMNNNLLYLGGTTPTGTAIRANGSRIEFLIGGTVRFYIDSTGGHNA